jgi:hypothetical protein
MHRSERAVAGRLSRGEFGDRQARRKIFDPALIAVYLALIRARELITRARTEITSRRAALTIKAVDPTNLSAALERQEIRAWVRTLDVGVRQAVVLATKDVRILEALLSAPPELSGIVDAVLAGKVEDRYRENVYPGELEQHEEEDNVIAQGEAAVAIALNEMQATIGLHQHDFAE